MQAVDPVSTTVPIADPGPDHALVEPAGAPEPPARRTLRALASDVGQGTVEYVGLLLLMASVLAAIVVASEGLGGKESIGKKVVDQVGGSIERVGKAEPGKKGS